MEILFFNNYKEIGEYMYNKAIFGHNITAALFFDDAVGLIRYLLQYDNIDIGGIDIAAMEYNGYSKEYYVTLSEDLTLDVEEAWHIDKYLMAEPDIMLIDGDASSAIIKDISKDNCREIYIGNGCSKDDLLDVIFDNAKIVTNEKDEAVGISFEITESVIDKLNKLCNSNSVDSFVIKHMFK
ncbi:MAG: hypothetical protein Q4G33_12670 [bacterium]|nr:hypothetical protein [bacterium]